MSVANSSAAAKQAIRIRWRGRAAYEPLWRAMRAFTDARSPDTPDEVWFAEHSPVFTMGLNAGREHLLAPGDIPVVDVDRGGQVTYHGPGQLMVYPLVDLRRAGLGVRDVVTALEQAAIDALAGYGIDAVCRKTAPGVYVNERKVASVGLRIRRGCSYHGMAFNVDMDIEPFSRINPCGYRGLEVTDLARLGVRRSVQETRDELLPKLLIRLGFEDRPVETV